MVLAAQTAALITEIERQNSYIYIYALGKNPKHMDYDILLGCLTLVWASLQYSPANLAAGEYQADKFECT